MHFEAFGETKANKKQYAIGNLLFFIYFPLSDYVLTKLEEFN